MVNDESEGLYIKYLASFCRKYQFTCEWLDLQQSSLPAVHSAHKSKLVSLVTQLLCVRKFFAFWSRNWSCNFVTKVYSNNQTTHTLSGQKVREKYVSNYLNGDIF